MEQKIFVIAEFKINYNVEINVAKILRYWESN